MNDAPYTVLVEVNPVKMSSRDYEHHKKDGKWKKVYFYRKRNKNEAVFNDCSSFKSYRTDTMYRVQHLCDADYLFDYFRILKPDIPDDVNTLGVELKNNRQYKPPDKKKYEYDKFGRVVLTFA
jgi:hypothetical protein|tara:strand:+ start:883 stop:1251 length:369 start_codon:yes stop_codon:yes gene_type:complete